MSGDGSSPFTELRREISAEWAESMWSPGSVNVSSFQKPGVSQAKAIDGDFST